MVADKCFPIGKEPRGPAGNWTGKKSREQFSLRKPSGTKQLQTILPFLKVIVNQFYTSLGKPFRKHLYYKDL